MPGFISGHILSWITFLPLIGMLVVILMNKERTTLIKWAALIFSTLPTLLAIVLYSNFDTVDPGVQFVERGEWIKTFNIFYFMGVDGLSITMVLLTVIISPLSVLTSFNIKDRVKEYFALILLLQTGMTGVFVSLDFFLFYVFWEVMLLPMYFLIGIWGGPRKEYAAIKFFLYTLFGSVFMLLAILALYYSSADANGLHSFDMLVLKDGHTLIHGTAAWLTFIALFVGFAIKVPIFPFHTWLPDAHVEAPTAISMILAGVLLKMGTYGILRVNYSMFPDLVLNKTWIYFLAILAVINIIYGALVAMAQKDLKKLVAYSSVSHMGYCLLGIAAVNVIGFQGCMLQMWNHGIITGALFLLVGVLYDRAHIREIDAFGGIAKQVPVYTTIMCIAIFASLGLPGLAGFVSEFLCFLGGFQMEMIQVLVGISVLGIVLTAAYLLRTVQKIFLGELNPRWSDLKEISTRELICAVPLVFFMFLFGVYPKPVLDLMESTLTMLVKGIGG